MNIKIGETKNLYGIILILAIQTISNWIIQFLLPVSDMCALKRFHDLIYILTNERFALQLNNILCYS